MIQFYIKYSCANKWYHLTFFFIFPILLHHNEVTYKNNYLLYTNIFSEYNRLHINCLVEVLIIFKLIYYFPWFKWISAYLLKVITIWTMCTPKRYKNFLKKLYLGSYVPLCPLSWRWMKNSIVL